ncbi:MAG: DMT family transporter [Gemmatimonadota bacterium]
MRSLTSSLRTAEAGLVLTAAIWGVNFSVSKAALATVPPLAFNALRYPLAGLAAAVALRLLGTGVRPRRRDLLTILALGALGNVIYQLLFIEGLDRTLAGNSGVLMATSPVWTAALAAPLAGERVAGTAWGGILLTLIGVSLVVLGGAAGGLGGDTLAGDLLTLGAAFTWALYTVLSIPMVRRYGALPVTVWTMWVGALVLPWFGLGQLREIGLGAIGAAEWAAVAYAGVLSITVAYVFWYHGVRVLGSAKTAAFGNLVPVMAIAVAWLSLGERPAPVQLAGAALTVLGVALARWRVAPAPARRPPT